MKPWEYEEPELPEFVAEFQIGKERKTMTFRATSHHTADVIAHRQAERLKADRVFFYQVS